jgi:hypothetical protein
VAIGLGGIGATTLPAVGQVTHGFSREAITALALFLMTEASCGSIIGTRSTMMAYMVGVTGRLPGTFMDGPEYDSNTLNMEVLLVCGSGTEVPTLATDGILCVQVAGVLIELLIAMGFGGRMPSIFVKVAVAQTCTVAIRTCNAGSILYTIETQAVGGLDLPEMIISQRDGRLVPDSTREAVTCSSYFLTMEANCGSTIGSRSTTMDCTAGVSVQPLGISMQDGAS